MEPVNYMILFTQISLSLGMSSVAIHISNNWTALSQRFPENILMWDLRLYLIINSFLPLCFILPYLALLIMLYRMMLRIWIYCDAVVWSRKARVGYFWLKIIPSKRTTLSCYDKSFSLSIYRIVYLTHTLFNHWSVFFAPATRRMSSYPSFHPLCFSWFPSSSSFLLVSLLPPSFFFHPDNCFLALLKPPFLCISSRFHESFH